jgi:hypothetical protein
MNIFQNSPRFLSAAFLPLSTATNLLVLIDKTLRLLPQLNLLIREINLLKQKLLPYSE